MIQAQTRVGGKLLHRDVFPEMLVDIGDALLRYAGVIAGGYIHGRIEQKLCQDIREIFVE